MCDGRAARWRAEHLLARANCGTLALLLASTLCGTGLYAQVSLGTAADLALRNSPRVKMEEATVDKARAAISEARDVYIPTFTGGSGLGYSYGFPIGQPSVFNFQSQALVYNSSQRDYLHAAHTGLNAATLALMDARQQVAADAALAFIAVQRDQKRDAGLAEEVRDARRLVTIVQDRANAGQDSAIDLTSAQLTAAQLNLDVLHAHDETIADSARLARLMDVPLGTLRVSEDALPFGPSPDEQAEPTPGNLSPGVQAAYASARAQAQIAKGDAHYLYRPQIAFGAEYDRFTKYNNYDLYYQRFQSNNAEIGIQIKLPLFDMGSRAKARDSAAEASRVLHKADMLRDQFLDGQLTLSHTAVELRGRAEVAMLEQQLARQQLDAMTVRVSSAATGGGPQMTPKDEQNARIAERQKYLAVIDATYEMDQAEINLMRQNGSLESWLKSTVATQPSAKPLP